MTEGNHLILCLTETLTMTLQIGWHGTPYRKVLLTWRGLLTRESESFGPFGTGTVSKSDISERHPVFRLEPESRAAADGNAESLDVEKDTKKRRALSRSAFSVNQRGTIVRSRL